MIKLIKKNKIDRERIKLIEKENKIDRERI